MDLQKIKGELEQAETHGLPYLFIPRADARELVGLIERQEAELSADVQALADSNLALQEQTALADVWRQQAETLEAELRVARAALKEYVDNSQEHDVGGQQPAAAPAAPAVQVLDERAAFEAWAKDRGFDVAIGPDGKNYLSGYTQGIWEPWQAALASQASKGARVGELAVWEGAMPESNGKSNFTALLYRKGAKGFDMSEDGFTIDRSEYPDRVRYEADRVRYLIGEIAERPCIIDYDADKHSGYAAPSPAQAQPVADAAQGDALSQQAVKEQPAVAARKAVMNYVRDLTAKPAE